MTVPTALLGALVFLGARGFDLNIYAQVGLLMLIGLASKNGILIVDLANQRMGEGLTAIEAARDACMARLRPILMTAISSLFGFLPLVFRQWRGGPESVALGTVVFGGLLVATVLSLFVVPVFYVVMKNLSGMPGQAVPAPSPPPPSAAVPEDPMNPIGSLLASDPGTRPLQVVPYDGRVVGSMLVGLAWV
jgi:HAE1 family hydrophobic/amphiphilic exporter-1